jgi:hypothetical protein
VATNADANHEGFRILRRDSALFPLELLWRWSFGLGLMALLFYAYAHLRQAVLISDADMAAFNSRDPITLANAAAAVLTELQPLLLRTFVQIAGIAAALWVATAALGRGILTRIIVRRFADEYSLTVAPDAPRWRAFTALKIARVLMLLILVIGYLAGELLAARTLPVPEQASAPAPNLLTPALILFACLAVAAVLWSYVNWILSLAPIFVVRDGLAPLDSIVAAIAFVRRNYPHLAAIATWNATLRGLTATLVTLAGVFSGTLYTSLPGWALTALLAIETLLYFVISDFFLLARLAAYSSVAVRELSLTQLLAHPASQPAP